MTFIAAIDPLTGLPYGVYERDSFQKVDVIPRFDKHDKCFSWLEQLKRLGKSLDNLQNCGFRNITNNEIDEMLFEFIKLSQKIKELKLLAEAAIQ